MAAARKAAGLTQKKLAELSGVSRVSIGRIECGDRIGHLNTIACLASVLGISIDEYVGNGKKEAEKK